MPAPFATIDTASQREHRLRNLMQSVILVGGMTVLLSLCAWLIWS